MDSRITLRIFFFLESLIIVKDKIIRTLGITAIISILYLERKPLSDFLINKLPKFLEDIFEPRVSDIKRIRRWRIPLADNGIVTVKDLINEAENYGLQRIKSYSGIGEIGINEIRIALWQKTGKWYPI